MLVLTRRSDESLVLTVGEAAGEAASEAIVITVLSVDGDKVKLGIQAPRHVAVLRQELCDAVRLQNLAAARVNLAAQTQTLETLRQMLAGAAPGVPPAE